MYLRVACAHIEHNRIYTCSPPPAPTLGRLQDVTVGKTRHMGFLKKFILYLMQEVPCNRGYEMLVFLEMALVFCELC